MKSSLAKSSYLREFITLIFIGVAIYFTSRAIFHEGFFRTIDDITTVRINHMARELVRWEPENIPVRVGAELSHNFGYFVYLFYSPLVYYAGALAMIFGGFSDIVATKIVYVFPLIVGPVLFYLAARIKLSHYSSLLATLIYTFFPFRGFDTYIRGGVGEAWAMAFLPGVFIGLFLYDKKSPYAPILVTFFLSIIILSHNLSALLALALIIVYLLFIHTKSWILYRSILHSLLITSFFYIPSLFYSSIVQIMGTLEHNGRITNYLLPMKNLLKPVFSYATHDKSSPWLIYILLIALITLLLRKKVNNNKKIFAFLTIIGIVLCFLMSRESIIFWDTFYSYLRPLQFPWRILILLSTVIPLVFGFLIDAVKSIWLKILSLILVVCLSYIYLPVFNPLAYHTFYNYKAEDTGPCATSWGEEYIPLWVKQCISDKPKFIAKLPEDSELSDISGNLLDTKFEVNTKTGGYIEANRYYFPGWQIKVDDQLQQVDYTYGKNGLFRTPLKQGTFKVQIYWEKTQLMKIVDYLSLFGLTLLVGETIYVLVNNRKK